MVGYFLRMWGGGSLGLIYSTQGEIATEATITSKQAPGLEFHPCLVTTPGTWSQLGHDVTCQLALDKERRLTLQGP